MIGRYSDWVLNNRWLVILITVCITLLLASGGRFLKLDNDYRTFFDAKDPQLNAFETLQSTYTKSDNILIVVAPKDGQVFTNETLVAIKDITERAWQIPFSQRVDSISNFQHTTAEEDDLMVLDLVDVPGNLTEQELENIKQVALKEPQLIYRLISDKAHVSAINVIIELSGKDPTVELPKSVAKARELKQYILTTYPHLDVYLTGIIMMNNAFPEASVYDIQNLIPLALLFMFLTVFIMLRGLWGTVATLLVVIMSVIAAMGSAGWLGTLMTSPMMSVPTIILTLAIADCVHLLSNWIQQQRLGQDKITAMRESLRINFTPIFLTSITTAIGFLSLNFSETPPFRDLGNTAAIGVILAWLLSVSFLPAVVTLLPSKVKVKTSSSSKIMNWLADVVIRNGKILLISMGALIVFLLAMIPRNELNDVFVKYFDERIEFRTDTDFVVKNLTGIYNIDFSLDAKENSGIAIPEFQAQTEKFANWLREQPEVIHVNSITDTMKRLNKNLHADDENYYSLPNQRDLAAQYLLLYEMSLPYGLDLNNQIDINKQSTRLAVTLHTITTANMLELEQRIQDWMQINTPEIKTWGASPAVMFAHIGFKNIISLLTGTLLALIAISFILMIALKSWQYGLLSLIPNLVPAGMAFGLWGLTNGEVGLSLSIVTAMTLGIVVDDTIHFLSKYIRARREKGLSAEDAVRYAFSTVGVALWVTSLALIAGFLVLATSAFSLNANMGLMVSIVIAFALIADFLFLPPLLIKLDKWLNPTAETTTQLPEEGHYVKS